MAQIRGRIAERRASKRIADRITGRNIVAHIVHRSAPRNALQKLASDFPGAVALQIRALFLSVQAL